VAKFYFQRQCSVKKFNEIEISEPGSSHIPILHARRVLDSSLRVVSDTRNRSSERHNNHGSRQGLIKKIRSGMSEATTLPLSSSSKPISFQHIITQGQLQSTSCTSRPCFTLVYHFLMPPKPQSVHSMSPLRLYMVERGHLMWKFMFLLWFFMSACRCEFAVSPFLQ
jgi:hypothetical protein